MAEALDGRRFAELEEMLEADGVRPVHTSALFRYLHRGVKRGFVPPLERWLAERNAAGQTPIELARETPSADGWTNKFLLRLEDGAEVEAVRMGYAGRFTVCLSTQVGCAMGCVFCATGRMGFRRHLKAGEIVAQARHVAEEVRAKHGERLRNVVMMGMGEPLHNFEETMRALDVMTDERGMNLTASRVTISTVGHVPGIRKLAELDRDYTLSVSLHGATDEERGQLVPLNRRWGLEELMGACRRYTEITGRRVWIAWTLIDGVNDDVAQAERLARLLAGMDVHVNLIPLNETEGYAEKESPAERVRAFQRVLRDAGLPVTVRQKRGIDVDAGCGQLAAR